MNKTNFSSKLSSWQFSLFLVNYVAGFGFVTTISGVVQLGPFGLITLGLTAFIAFAVVLVFSRLSSSFPHNFGGSYNYAKVAFGTNSTSFFLGWNQFIRSPILSAVSPLFLADALNILVTDDRALLGIRIGSIVFFGILILVSTLGLKLNKKLIFATGLIKWLVIFLGIIIALILSIQQGKTAYPLNFNNANNASVFLIFTTTINFMYSFGGIEEVAVVSPDANVKNFKKIFMYSFAAILTFYFVTYIIIMGLQIGPKIKNFSEIYNILTGATGVIIFVTGLIFKNISSHLSGNYIIARQILPLANDGFLPKLFTRRNKKDELGWAIGFYAGVTLFSLLIFWLIPQLAKFENFFNQVIQIGIISFFAQYIITMITALILEKRKIVKSIPIFEKIVYILAIAIMIVSLLIFIFPPVTNNPWKAENTVIIISYPAFIGLGYILYLGRYLNDKRKAKKVYHPDTIKTKELQF